VVRQEVFLRSEDNFRGIEGSCINNKIFSLLKLLLILCINSCGKGEQMERWENNIKNDLQDMGIIA